MMEIKTPPTVSIIIPTYNRAHLISRAIESVLNQTYQDFEIIVVDDGSTDNTEEAVKGFGNPRIRYIKYKENKGAAFARNRGIEVARGKLITFQDSDDEWFPQKLAKQIRVFETAGSDAGMIYTDMLHICKEKRKIRYWDSPDITCGKVINEETLDYQVKRISLPTILIKKEYFGKIGLFDEQLPLFIDLDFFIRLSSHCHFYHIKEPLVKYYVTRGISSNAKNKAIARILLIKKYFEDCKYNKKFLAKQYFEAATNFCLSADVLRGIYYLNKAIKTYPSIVKFMLGNFVSKILRCYKSKL